MEFTGRRIMVQRTYECREQYFSHCYPWIDNIPMRMDESYNLPLCTISTGKAVYIAGLLGLRSCYGHLQ